MQMNRRQAIASTAAGATSACAWASGVSFATASDATEIPTYIQTKDLRDMWLKDPLKANTEWFRKARLGMFLHYGINGMMGVHTWYMYGKYYVVKNKRSHTVGQKAPIPIRDFEKLAETFTASKFDADFITDLALEAGCQYVNITTRHHDGFCLWDSDSEPFNSKNAAAKRDLVQELSDACAKKGLAFLPYWSIARDWRHPHAPPGGRPPYAKFYGKPDPHYATPDDQDLEKYNEFARKQITELFTKYKLAGIWFDGVGVGRGLAKELRLKELYEDIHRRWPGSLVSYKNGVTGTEDFLDAEGLLHGAGYFDSIFFKLVERDVPREVCSNLGRSWAFAKQFKGLSMSRDGLWNHLESNNAQHCNWLVNTGPMPKGDIDPAHVTAYRTLGELVRKRGFPKIGTSAYERQQDRIVQRFAKGMQKKPFLSRVESSKDEKVSAANVLANHLMALTVPPSQSVRRQHYREQAEVQLAAHRKTFAMGDTLRVIDKMLAGKYAGHSGPDKDALYKDIEEE